MPSLRNLLGAVVLGCSAIHALPTASKHSHPKLSRHEIAANHLLKTRQALPALNDVDILQFALTLEFLETSFYQQGLAQFPASDFSALGLDDQAITDLQQIGQTEATHVETLLSAIAGQGIQPVAPCTYNFGFTDAASMVATASVLENVGVSAYLGAAPLVTDPSILGVAASIVTVESRHQSFMRLVSQSVAVPSAFDTALGPRNVFGLAAAFIDSCPDTPSSLDLGISPFSSLTATAQSTSQSLAQTGGFKGNNAQIGDLLILSSDVLGNAAGNGTASASAASGNMFCAFTNGGLPGGSVFTQFDASQGGCTVPQNLAGITYLNLASEAPTTGALTDDITLAGPMVLQIS